MIIRGRVDGEIQERTAFILFTDIYRSTQLWEEFGQDFKRTLERHNDEVEETISNHGGEIMKNLGDGYIAIYGKADDCLGSGVEIQRKIKRFQPLPDSTKLKVRVVAHGGTLMPLATGKGYFGQPLNRASRICQVCYPGQMLVSQAVKSFVGAPPTPLKFLDLGPHRLRDLAEPERLYQVDHPEFETHEFGPLPTLVGYRPNNLVIQPNAFVGRGRELEELTSIIVDNRQRLVTITAAGGYGKSRLVMQLSADLLDHFENGVFAVLLAPLGEHSRIPTSTADALGFKLHGDSEPTEQIINYLREKEMLIHFDNFEHVLEGRDFVAEILKHAPGVSVVATSREPLRLQAEQVFSLEPLPYKEVPAAGEYDMSDAVVLFIDRAKLVKRNLRLNPQNLALIQSICEKLAGVPLAIELAAAWADSFTLPELLSELETQLKLTARMTDIAQRHRSLRASLDWSYRLMSNEQRAVLRAVSTFKGGFFLDAAGSVTPMRQLRVRLSQLRDKSWLYARETDGRTRFFVRDAAAHEYTFEKLRESDGWEMTVIAHSRNFAELAAQEGEKLYGRGQLEAAKVFGNELENIYEALDTALNFKYEMPGDERLRLLLPFALHLFNYLDFVSRWRDGLGLARRLKDAGAKLGDPLIRARAGVGLSLLLVRLSRLDEAESVLADAKRTAAESKDDRSLAEIERISGIAAYLRGSFDVAEKRLLESLRLFRETEGRWGIAQTLGDLGTTKQNRGCMEEAEELHRESLAISREAGDRWGISIALNNLGLLAHARGRFDEAKKLYGESLETSRELGDRRGTAEGLNHLGDIALDGGHLETAGKLYQESLEIHRETGDRRGIADGLNSLGVISFDRGDLDDAEALSRESLDAFREIGDCRGIADGLNCLGDIAQCKGRTEEAESLYHEAIEEARVIGDRKIMSSALSALGLLCAKQGRLPEGASFISQSLVALRGSANRLDLLGSIAAGGAFLSIAGLFKEAAVVLFGSGGHADRFGYVFAALVRQARTEGAELLLGALSPQERDKAASRGEKMTFEEAANFALAALKNIGPSSQRGPQ